LFTQSSNSRAYDSVTDKWGYMPAKFSSDIKFEGGPALLGLPIPSSNTDLTFIIRNTTVLSSLKLHTGSPESIIKNIARTWTNYRLCNKRPSFGNQHRPDSLTAHEKGIYKMVDSPQKPIKRFQQDIKLVAFCRHGLLGLWQYYSCRSLLIFHQPQPAWRLAKPRFGLWTLPGVSKRANISGYLAYGGRDKKWKRLCWLLNTSGMTLNGPVLLSVYGYDYDFLIGQPWWIGQR